MGTIKKNTTVLQSTQKGPKRKDITGVPFGDLVPIKDVGRNKQYCRMWLCECACGNTEVLSIVHLRTRTCCNKCMALKSKFCKKGHWITGDNEFINSKGYRVCLTCRRENSRKTNKRVRQTSEFKTPYNRRKRHLWRHFHMTPEDYDKMVKHQNGGCAICHTPTSEGQSLHVDHDHSCCSGEKSCGKCIRGLLCQKCNHALGLLGDNILKLEKAIDYLTPSKFVVEEVA